LLKPAARKAERRFLVEGPQAVREAKAAGALTGVFATETAAQAYADLLGGVRVTVVGDRALAGLSETVTPQGLVGVADSLERTVDDAIPAPMLVGVLVDARDPGNAGAVIRVADAAGADAVVFASTVGGGSVDPHNGKCVRASTGSVFHLPIGVGTLDETLAVLRDRGLRVLAADGAASPYVDLEAPDADLERPTAVLFGNEAHGLPTAALDAADAVVRVPIHGRAESLNLAVAAALCLYACARAQRA
jgi:TrmH family RNA methyltransferase